ncbi:hypothetical protein HPB48_023539 [Haemaphysalis longicornis]|uniref:poly(A)-specific ribonuclease n=1 Tax=Haemaphysalis longicornis TaxID=44386 RepID=A0A9J6H7A2_HAELO|nr:hypothetical protein HPB48_023539 [Haemaphysalis longicornis]
MLRSNFESGRHPVNNAGTGRVNSDSSGPDARSEFRGTERLVWPPNLEQGLDTIAHLVQTHHYAAMDTEFPGVLQWPHESQLCPYHYQYSLVRDNVNLMNIIPVGMTFPDRGGNPVPSCCTRFYTKTDRCDNDSIRPLVTSVKPSKEHEEDDLDLSTEPFASCGVALSESARWLAFHGGFYFGYLLKVLIGQALPNVMYVLFYFLLFELPAICDVKCITNRCPSLQGMPPRCVEDPAITNPVTSPGGQRRLPHSGLSLKNPTSAFLGKTDYDKCTADPQDMVACSHLVPYNRSTL